MSFLIYNKITKEVLYIQQSIPENLESNFDYVEHQNIDPNRIKNFNIYVRGDALESSLKSVSEKATYTLKEENERLREENQVLKLALAENAMIAEENKIELLLAIAEIAALIGGEN